MAKGRDNYDCSTFVCKFFTKHTKIQEAKFEIKRAHCSPTGPMHDDHICSIYVKSVHPEKAPYRKPTGVKSSFYIEQQRNLPCFRYRQLLLVPDHSMPKHEMHAAGVHFHHQ